MNFIIKENKMNKIFIYLVLIIPYLTLSLDAQEITFKKIYGAGFSIAVLQDNNGEYLLTGNAQIPVAPGPSGMYLIKTNNLGDTLWTKLYGSINENTNGMNVAKSADGNYIACGIVSQFWPFAYTDIILTKLNEIGDTLWWKKYNINDSPTDYARDLKIINDDIYLVGRNGNQGLLLKTDGVGALIFNKTFKLSTTSFTEFKSIQQTDDNNLYLFGLIQFVTPDYRTFSKYILLKTNLDGDSLFTISIGDDSCEVSPFNLVKAVDGNFIFSGYTHNIATQEEYTLISKYNSDGVQIWEKRVEPTARKLAATSDGGIVFYGKNNTNITLTKLDAESNIVWSREMTFPEVREIQGTDIKETSDGGFIITGYLSLSDNVSRIFLLKTNSEGLLTSINIENTFPNSFVLSQNYPNPFNPSTRISWQYPVGGLQTLKIYDVLGNEIATLVNEWRETGRYSVEYKADNLPSGVYVYQLKVNDFISSKKMILIK